MSVLILDAVRKSFAAHEVVAGISLRIERGDCFGLLGPNGAGKSTTLRLCLGLLAPDGGSVRLLDGQMPKDGRSVREKVGVVPQMDNLDPDFSVAENLYVYGRYFGIEAKALHARIPELLEFAGLGGRGDAQIRTLSGGMKRRLTLARALINDPEFIVLDEPTTGLDPQARHLIWDRLKELTRRGKTLLLTTHFMDEAERLCNRLAVIDAGKLIAEGTPRELIERTIESDVVEVYGDGAVPFADQAKALAERVEVSGETVFCYTRDPKPVIAALAGSADAQTLRYLHRPANLEDVFIKLTGRELRD